MLRVLFSQPLREKISHASEPRGQRNAGGQGIATDEPQALIVVASVFRPTHQRRDGKFNAGCRLVPLPRAPTLN